MMKLMLTFPEKETEITLIYFFWVKIKLFLVKNEKVIKSGLHVKQDLIWNIQLRYFFYKTLMVLIFS